MSDKLALTDAAALRRYKWTPRIVTRPKGVVPSCHFAFVHKAEVGPVCTSAIRSGPCRTVIVCHDIPNAAHAYTSGQPARSGKTTYPPNGSNPKIQVRQASQLYHTLMKCCQVCYATVARAWQSSQQYLLDARQLLWSLHYPLLGDTVWLTVAVVAATCAFMAMLHFIDLACLHLTASKYASGKFIAAALRHQLHGALSVVSPFLTLK